ncbi:hypothetical protein JMA_40230 (plasmid) [Jeotgalibacillus malaysiensis]|uniref:DUF2726 domain-containing protein n=1 Tax=Jeotgalibacillus malaysiensis TaxID=1508404 RepID=A0A0B5ATD1_9BACL|nr:hypothetical protein [Jeotgalibacillus malaysiensis]AJD93341.1 hypothetical protein JMA_40230 [Jeotgalibacillus malaysiensis]
MPKKKTHEEFEKEVLEIGKGEYELLSQYQNTRTKVLLKHVVCGNEYEVRPMNFLDGRRCAHCRGISPTQFIKKNSASFKDEVEQLSNGEFTVVGEYSNAHTKVEIKHNRCKKVHGYIPTAFLSRKGYCVFCGEGKKNRKTTDSFANEVSTSTNNEYELLSAYITSREKVTIRHRTCGYEYEVTPHNFSRGSRCPKCAGVMRKTHVEFMNQFQTLKEEEYEVLSEYVNSYTPIRFKHFVCGSEFMISPGKFLNGGRCTNCRSSKGKRLVEKILIKMGVIYKKQVKLEGCQNINFLPFDFGIFDDFGKPLFLIEYDGIQHYKEKDFFGGRSGYLTRVQNDRIKSNYAKDKGIPLLRIRYDEKDAEKLLLHAIKNYFKNNGNSYIAI